MIFALLTTAHFGIGDVLPWMVRQAGFRAGPLFRSPLKSESLSDFWSRRWNLAFVEMDRLLFLRPLRKRWGARGAIFGVFIISGLFHGMGISYPAGAGWGGPMLYFLGHGLLVTLVEPKIKSRILRRLLVWLAILILLPLLFHEPFRESLVLPFADAISTLLHARSFDWYLHAALWLGSIAHFCILGASFQVPQKLKWREDFASLSRFNRKIFWTYGAFIVGCIIAFGVLTSTLRNELFRGDRAAVGLSLFIGALWTARVLTDLFYFKDEDWPRGWQFEIGHVLLTFTFVCLAVLYGIVVPTHAWLGRGMH
jgi:alginate O-acetyltransferase complex protein AlgI